MQTVFKNFTTNYKSVTIGDTIAKLQNSTQLIVRNLLRISQNRHYHYRLQFSVLALLCSVFLFLKTLYGLKTNIVGAFVISRQFSILALLFSVFPLWHFYNKQIQFSVLRYVFAIKFKASLIKPTFNLYFQ